MRILHDAREVQPPNGRVCCAIGLFDGVHLGHQQVLRQAVSDAHQLEATPLCVTFSQHPAAVLAPDRAPGLIQHLPQRLAAIEALGIEATLLLPFDETMSQIPAEMFIQGLYVDLGRIQSICVGAHFAFGHQRQGNVDLLQRLGQEMNFIVHGLASVSLDDETVSSTRIRQAIEAGQLDAAGQMLGREYALTGEVIQGDQRGRTLGYPTANLEATALCLPPNGVYAAHAQVGEATHRAAVNIGHRPTLADADPRLHVEAHLLDFEGDLYGQDLALTFVGKLREEQKFETPTALKTQIQKDLVAARYLFTQL
ncbi:MAG: bifunctional riboflavin kinase/FAD synthetase [Verrucomicrobia subdivision 3 bacterium]|nr:bifunctional riboflavin kinase/FAD synthetase [Limisphaerales bacterium]